MARVTDLQPVVLEAYDAAGNYLDPVLPMSCRLEPQWHGFGAGALVIEHDDPQAEVLTAPGARLVARYRHDPANPLATKHVLSGRIKERSLEGDIGERVRAFSVVDDFGLFADMTAWANPAGTAAQQGDDEAYDTITGPAETVVKSAITRNLAHYPSRLPIVVPASLGRGSTITAAFRFHPLHDRLWPAVDSSGITVGVRQNGAQLVVDVSVPTTYPEVLTERSGIVLPGGELSLSEPTVTRAVVLGQGQGTARTVVYVVPGVADAVARTTRSALEQEWGVVREVTVDARDTNDPTVLRARGMQKIAEGAPKAVGRVQLAETDDFRYGIVYDLGTTLTVELNGQPAVTDRVRSVGLSWDGADGVVVTPMLGDAVPSRDKMIERALANVLRIQRDMGVI